ncbi:APA family fibronectin-binding glycoprotein [Nocardia blacklockiae]|uniref:APA family fibronectin-binding glycoprotein n=1 Tax=Nocardia blacklockiae TaxID=480036 RepID=UPI001895CF72|nr:APA family fibronectin-binding glycoprotein [Nocardia blacklockiae]MBF6171545.1 hypothetical protein [Nocardia blacklockiae]
MSLFTVRRLAAALAGGAAVVALALPAVAAAEPAPGPPAPPQIETGPDGQRFVIGPEGQRILIGPDGRGEFTGPDGRRVVIVAPGDGAPGGPGPCEAAPGGDPGRIHIERDDVDDAGRHVIICSRR